LKFFFILNAPILKAIFLHGILSWICDKFLRKKWFCRYVWNWKTLTKLFCLFILFLLVINFIALIRFEIFSIFYTFTRRFDNYSSNLFLVHFYAKNAFLSVLFPNFEKKKKLIFWNISNTFDCWGNCIHLIVDGCKDCVRYELVWLRRCVFWIM